MGSASTLDTSAPISELVTEGATTSNPEVLQWVTEVAELTQPAAVVWCNGSQDEWNRITSEMVEAGTLIALNKDLRPGSFLARSHPADVARVEDRTFICSENEADAGPTNNWRAPAEMKAELMPLFEGSMRGRTMYVVPFSMGPVGGAITQLGIEITDSPYAVLNMRIMTRMGQAALDGITPGSEWVRTVHSVGAPLVDGVEDVAWPCNDLKYITHFPETLEVWSYGSGYGGNALLSKKCFALRIASVMGKNEGWLAEHMLLLKLTNTESGKAYHLSAAFPSACGKTNLAMLPFCGYNMADYWGHWLEMGEKLGDKAPKIFQVNWFRKGADGRFLWPGFGDNSRVIDWIIRSVEGEHTGRETAIGTVPAAGELNLSGIESVEAELDELFAIDATSWLAECDLTEEFFAKFGDRLPQALEAELSALRSRLSA